MADSIYVDLGDNDIYYLCRDDTRPNGKQYTREEKAIIALYERLEKLEGGDGPVLATGGPFRLR